jgi:predicted SnoaL-like aldol condensation-catalyzing enzyme
MVKLNFFTGMAAGIGLTGLVAAGGVLAAKADQEQIEARNAAVAVDFYNAALNEKDWEKTKSFMGDDYIQHNPHAVDGYKGLHDHVEMLKTTFPENHGDIKQVIADGDLVALHVHSKRTPDSLGNAVVDIFRLKDGKVVEHWDVVQPVPEESLNENTMF